VLHEAIKREKSPQFGDILDAYELGLPFKSR